MANQLWAREAAAHFIDSTASSRRQMAVVEFGGVLFVAQNFTANTDRLKQVVKNMTPGAVHTNSSDPVAPPQLASVSAMSLGGESNFAARTMLLAIRSLSKNLGSLPGRKTLILFSEGFPLTPETQSELTATIDAANKANVAIYPLDARGLQAGPDALVPVPPMSQLRIPDWSRTGGEAIRDTRDTPAANASADDSPRRAPGSRCTFAGPSAARRGRRRWCGGRGRCGRRWRARRRQRWRYGDRRWRRIRWWSRKRRWQGRKRRIRNRIVGGRQGWNGRRRRWR